MSLVTVFNLNSILCNISITTLAVFWFPFVWNVFPHQFTLNPCVSLKLNWVSCRQQIVESCVVICSAIVCNWTGEFNPFIFNVIIDRYELTITILLIFFWLFGSAFLPLFLSCYIPLRNNDFLEWYTLIPSFYLGYIYDRFLFCCFFEAYLKNIIDKAIFLNTIST